MWAPRPPLPKAGGAKTGPLPLHPMTTADILDGAFKLFKANAAALLVTVAVIAVPLQIVSAFLARSTFSYGLINVINDPTVARSVNESRSNSQLAAQLLTAGLGILTAPFIAGAVSRIVAASYLGESLGATDALKVALRRAPALLVSFVLVHLLELLGFVFCVLPGFAVMTMFAVVAPAIAIEELGPIKGMGRSWRLVRPRFWAVLGISLLAGLLANVITSIIGGAPQVIGLLAGGSWAWILIAASGAAARLIASPLVAIVATLLYFDGRIRHEGLDLQLMAAQLSE